MAKQKPKAGADPTEEQAAKKNYRPQRGVMLRLPPSHRGPLEALKKKHRRTIVNEVAIALEKHYKDEGVEFKE